MSMEKGRKTLQASPRKRKKVKYLAGESKGATFTVLKKPQKKGEGD